MGRPKTLHVGGTLYWVLRTYDPADGVAPIDADSVPTVAIRKNGASVGDSVTVTKRAATTGIYDCSYNPAGEAEGDKFTVEESATISATTYTQSWEFTVVAVERGTDSAITSGTGAGQLTTTDGKVALQDDQPVDAVKWGGVAVASANVRANLVQILGSAITGTAAQIVAAFTKFFNVATPTGTVNSLPDAVAGAAGGVAIVGSQMTLTSGQVTAIVAAIEAEIADDLTGEAVKQAIIDKMLENLPDIDDLSLSAIANATRDAILDRLLSGNHDTPGTPGSLLQRLDVLLSTRSSQISVDNLPALSDMRREVERVAGVRDWGVVGDAAIEPVDGDNGFCSWPALIRVGSTVYRIYTALDSGGKQILRMGNMGADGKTVTGASWTICQGDQVYDSAGVFLASACEVEGSTVHLFYCGMPSLFANQQICRMSCPTSDLVSGWTKHGVAIAYDAVDLPAGLHNGIEPTGLMKWNGNYYLYGCSVPGSQRALPSSGANISVDDRRGFVAVSPSVTDWSTRTIHMLLADDDEPSRVQPWRYLISPHGFRSSSSTTAQFYLFAAVSSTNTDYQRGVIFSCHNPLFQAPYTEYVTTFLTVRDQGGSFPNGEIDVFSLLTTDINKHSFPALGEILLTFGGKNIGDQWKMGLCSQTSITEALRPGLKPIGERLLQSLPLRPGSTIDERELAVKAKTDQLTFTLANQVDANALTGGGGGGGATPGEIADAVLDELLSGHTTAGSVGKALIDLLAAGGSLTVEQAELLEMIGAKVALLTAGRRPQVVSNVAAGGRLDLYVGDDYVGDDAISLPIEDVGGVIHDRLTAAGVDSVVLGASLDRRATNLITGTITDISYASDETTLTIEIAHSDISTEAPLSDDYQYQISRVMAATGSDGEPLQIIEITGPLMLSRRHVARVTA